MIKRIDTTNLTKGAIASLAIFLDTQPNVDTYFFDAVTHTYTTLQNDITQNGTFFKATTKLPFKDGFLLAKINNSFNIVKKVGFVMPHFVIGYKANYTIPYKLFRDDGTLIKEDVLKEIVNGFYYCETDYNAQYIELLQSKIALGNTMTKLEYDVVLGDSVIDDINLPNVSINVTLGDATLGDATLGSVNFNVALPNVEIKG